MCSVAFSYKTRWWNLPQNERPARAVLIQWKDVVAMTGHIVDVDRKGLLISVVHVGDNRFPTDYSNGEVLVPRTGITYTRARRVRALAERNELQSEWQWLMQMWKAKISRDIEKQLASAVTLQGEEESRESRSTLTCSICNDTSSQAGIVLTCPLCLLSSHEYCAAKLLAWGKSHNRLPGQLPEREPSHDTGEPNRNPSASLSDPSGARSSDRQLTWTSARIPDEFVEKLDLAMAMDLLCLFSLFSLHWSGQEVSMSCMSGNC